MEHTCPACGYEFECEAPRHGERGTGAHYASRIKHLNHGHLLVLSVLKDAHAVTFETGLRLSDVWYRARDYSTKENKRWPTKQGLSGRLSELQGLGQVKSMNNKVRLVDPASQKYRFESQQRWFLTQPC